MYYIELSTLLTYTQARLTKIVCQGNIKFEFKSGSYSASNSIFIINLPVFEVDEPNFSTSPLKDKTLLAILLTTE